MRSLRDFFNSVIPDAANSRLGCSFARVAKAGASAGKSFGQGLVRHAGKLSMLGYAAGNITMMAKPWLTGEPPNAYEQVAGGGFMVSNIFMGLSDRNPFYKKPAGFCTLLGSTILAAGGVGMHGQNAQIGSCIVIGLLGASMMAEDWLNNQVQRISKAGCGLLSRAFSCYAAMPVMTAAACNSAASLLLAYAAGQRGDIGLYAASMMFVTGGLGLMLTDNKIKRAVLGSIKPQAKANPQSARQSAPRV